MPNICVTPAFLAKVTGTDPATRSLLAYRVYDLYGWVPEGGDVPPEPPGYWDREWASPPSAVRAAVRADATRKAEPNGPERWAKSARSKPARYRSTSCIPDPAQVEGDAPDRTAWRSFLTATR